jgi:hypothetical protein
MGSDSLAHVVAMAAASLPEAQFCKNMWWTSLMHITLATNLPVAAIALKCWWRPAQNFWKARGGWTWVTLRLGGRCGMRAADSGRWRRGGRPMSWTSGHDSGRQQPMAAPLLWPLS